MSEKTAMASLSDFASPTIPEKSGLSQRGAPPPSAYLPEPQQPYAMQPYAMQQQFTGSQTQLVHPGVQLQMTGAGYPLQQQASLAHQQVFVPQQQGLEMVQPFGAPQQLFTAIPLASLGQGPAPADCPACRHRTVTTVNAEIGKTTHAWAAVVCFVLGLGCIPYLMTSLKDVRHNCGHCGVLLATWHRSGHTVVHTHG